MMSLRMTGFSVIVVEDGFIFFVLVLPRNLIHISVCIVFNLLSNK